MIALALPNWVVDPLLGVPRPWRMSILVLIGGLLVLLVLRRGPRLVRFFNQDGASALRFFIVSEQPELLEKEPNDEYSAPQVIPSLPATQGGRLDKGGDVDSMFSLADLDQKPRPIVQTNPVMTPQMRKAAPATVYILLVVDERGRVENPIVQSSTDPLFEAPALAASHLPPRPCSTAREARSAEPWSWRPPDGLRTCAPRLLDSP